MSPCIIHSATRPPFITPGSFSFIAGLLPTEVEVDDDDENNGENEDVGEVDDDACDLEMLMMMGDEEDDVGELEAEEAHDLTLT